MLIRMSCGLSWDSVDSDLEDDVDNLMVDSDTEFETISDDAAKLLQNDWKETEVLISSNYLEAVVRPSSTIPILNINIRHHNLPAVRIQKTLRLQKMQ